MVLVNQSIPEWFVNVAKPFVSNLYLMCGEVTVEDLPLRMYEPDSFIAAINLSQIANAQTNEFSVTSSGVISDKLVMIGNYSSQPVKCFIANEPVHDFLTDLLYSSMKSLLACDISNALSIFGAYMLVSRMLNDRVPILLPEITDIEVTPHAL